MTMEGKIRATRRDSTEASIAATKEILAAVEAAQSDLIDIMSVIDEADNGNISEEQRAELDTRLGLVIDNLTEIYASAVAAIAGVSVVAYTTSALHDP